MASTDNDPLGLFSTDDDNDPLGLFSTDSKEKASLGTAAKSSLASLGNTFDTAGTMLAGGLTSLFSKDRADEIYRRGEENNKARNQWANPDNQELSFAGKVLGAPAGLVSFPLSPFETGKSMLDNGESLGTAVGGVGVATAGNAAGMLIPGALGVGALAKVGSGAAINAAQTYAQSKALQGISSTDESKKQFAPNLEDIGVAAVIGGGFGGMHARGDSVARGKAEQQTQTRLSQERVQKQIEDNLRADQERLAQEQALRDQEIEANRQKNSFSPDPEGRLPTLNEDPLGLFSELPVDPNLTPRLEQGFPDLSQPQAVNEAPRLPFDGLPQEPTVAPDLGINPADTPLPELNRLPQEQATEAFPNIDRAELPIDRNAISIPDVDSPLPRLPGSEVEPVAPQLFRATREARATNADMPSRIAAKLEAEGLNQRSKKLPKLDDGSLPEITLNREDFGPTELGPNETAIPSRLVDFSHGGIDVNSLLDHFSKNSIDPAYASLAESLKGKLGTVDVAISMKDGIPQDYHTNPAGMKVRGTYSTSDLIMLGKKGMTDRVFLHEAIHAATAKFLRAFPDAEGSVALKNLYEQMLPKATEAGLLSKNAEGKFTDERGYAFHNVDEFVAEAMTNRKLQDWLKTHTIDGQRYVPQSRLSSAWDTFKQAIGRLLGLDSKAYTALDNVMDIAGDIIETNNTYREAVNDGFSQLRNKIIGKAALNAPDEPIRSTNDVRADTSKAVEKLAGITPTFDVNIAENMEVYRAEKDISNDNNAFKSGTQFTSLLNNKNALVRDVGRVFRSELNEGRALEAKYLTNSVDGVLALRDKLSKTEFIDLQMVLRTAEGKMDLSPTQMRELGLNDKQIAVASKIRESLDATLDGVNAVLRAKGKPEIERRAGYLPGTFKGDFRTIVTQDVLNPKTNQMETKFVSVIADNNRRAMQKIVDKLKSENPQFKFDIADKQTNAKYRDRDSFAAFEQALAIVGDNSPEAQRVQAMYQDYKSQSAFNSTSMKKHFMNKKGGDTGAEGFKAWENDATNAKEGFRAMLDYVETANKWLSVNKAVDKVSPALTDPQVIKAQPNSVAYLSKYINTIQGKPNAEFLNGIPKGLEDIVSGIFNMTADATGFGPTQLKAPINELAKYTQLAWMGLRPVFSTVQMLQYSATLPKKFADFSPLNVIKSELAGMASSTKMLAQLNKSIRMGKKGIEVDGSSINNPFDREMYRYMVDTGLITQSVLMDIRSLDQPAWVNKIQDVASINMRIPEILTRTTAFTTFAQNYKNLGLSNRAAFEKAMEATDFTMGNYKPEERPLLYQQGWATQKLGALQTYKHNQIGQIRSYFQDAKTGKPTGLAMYTLTMLAMGGIIGLPAMEQADAIADKLSMMLFNKPFSVKRWLMTNVPEIYTRGAITNLTRNLIPEGVDLGSSMSAADLVGSGAEGYITDNYKKAVALATLVTSNTTTERAQAARDLVPMQFKGTLENNFLSKPIYNENGQETGNRLTVDSDLQGDVVRTPMEQTLRNYGATSVKERNTKDLNFAAQREERSKTELRSKAVDRLAALYYDGKLTDNMDADSKKVYTKAYQMYIANGGDPTALQNAVTQAAMNQNITTVDRNIGKPKNIRSIDKAQTYMEGR